MCRKLCHFIKSIEWFHWSKDYEAMKAGKLAIRPWLSCPYSEHRLVDLPSSLLSLNRICSRRENLNEDPLRVLFKQMNESNL